MNWVSIWRDAVSMAEFVLQMVMFLAIAAVPVTLRMKRCPKTSRQPVRTQQGPRSRGQSQGRAPQTRRTSKE